MTIGSDIYSLGALLYKLLCGYHPHASENIARFDLEQAICHIEPRKPSQVAHSKTPSLLLFSARSADRARLRRRLAGDLDAIVLRALRKEPEERYSSVEQLSQDIKHHLQHKPSSPATARARTT